MGKLIAFICHKCHAFVNVERGENCNCNDSTKGDKKCSTEFKPFYSDETKTMITSSRQMDRVYKKHGLRPLGDAPFRKKYENLARHKEEYLISRHKEDGLNYKGGSNVRWSDKRQDFVSPQQFQREKAEA